MSESYSVSLQKIIENHSLEVIYLPKDANDILVVTNEINRPGIVLTGYIDYFDPLRIQILGWTEFGFLQNMSDFSTFNEVYGKYFISKPARSCVAAKELPKGVLVEVELIAEV